MSAPAMTPKVYKIIGFAGTCIITALSKPGVTINVNSNNNTTINDNRVNAATNASSPLGGLAKVVLGKSLYIECEHELTAKDEMIQLRLLTDSEVETYNSWNKLNLEFFWWTGNNELFKKWLSTDQALTRYADEVYFINYFLQVFNFNSQGISVNKRNYATIVSFFNDDRIVAQITRYTKIRYNELPQTATAGGNNVVNRVKRSIIAYFSLAFSALVNCMQTLSLQSESGELHFDDVLSMLDLESLDSIDDDNKKRKVA